MMSTVYELGAIQDGLKNVLIGLELVRMIEQDVFVLLEPLLGFQSHMAQHN